MVTRSLPAALHRSQRSPGPGGATVSGGGVRVGVIVDPPLVVTGSRVGTASSHSLPTNPATYAAGTCFPAGCRGTHVTPGGACRTCTWPWSGGNRAGPGDTAGHCSPAAPPSRAARRAWADARVRQPGHVRPAALPHSVRRWSSAGGRFWVGGGDLPAELVQQAGLAAHSVGVRIFLGPGARRRGRRGRGCRTRP